MPKEKLTEELIETIDNDKSYTIDLFDTDVSGLILRITPNNYKSFCYRYEENGKNRRITFGSYPQMELNEAKSRAYQIKSDMKKGLSPNEAEKQRQYRRKNSKTFSDLADDFMELNAHNYRSSTEKSYQGYLDRDLIPAFGDIYLDNISKNKVGKFLDNKVKEGKRTTANKLRNLISVMFNWALEKDYMENITNPVVHLSKYTPTGGKGGRDRIYTPEEIERIWWAIKQLRNSVTEAYFKILFFCGQRRTETLKMEWAHIDFDEGVWTIPKNLAKNYEAHRVPLSYSAHIILEELKQYSGDNEYVFESPRRKHKTKPINSVKNSVKAIKNYSEVEDFRMHDIRRTIVSYLAQMKVPQEVLGRIINHRKLAGQTSITSVYNRYGYEEEKRKALEKWDKKLMEIVERV